jgi:hypothetical protein
MFANDSKALIFFFILSNFRCQDINLSPAKVAHITKRQFQRASEVLNTVVFLNNLAEAPRPTSAAIEFASSLLQSLLPDLDEEMQTKMSFLLEQLELLQNV